MNPEEILAKDALAKSHRIIIDPLRDEHNQIRTLSRALKDSLKEELLQN